MKFKFANFIKRIRNKGVEKEGKFQEKGEYVQNKKKRGYLWMKMMTKSVAILPHNY